LTEKQVNWVLEALLRHIKHSIERLDMRMGPLVLEFEEEKTIHNADAGIDRKKLGSLFTRVVDSIDFMNDIKPGIKKLDSLQNRQQ